MLRREARAEWAWQLIERQLADGPPKGSALGVRNTPIAYDVIGEPADSRGVIVLLMGLGMNGRMWGPAVRRARARGYAVVTIDARGGGRSRVPWRPWSTATMAGDVVAVMDRAKVAVAHVAGISLGGMVAQEVALRHPDRVGGLCLVATTGGVPRVDLLPISALPRLLGGTVSPPPPDEEARIRRVLELGVDAAWAATVAAGSEEWEAARAMLDDPTGTRGTLLQLLAAARHRTWHRLGSIRAPTLVQHGDADGLISSRAGELLAEAIPNARLRLYPGGGHALGLQLPEALEDAFDFFDEHEHLLTSSKSPPGS